MKRERCIWFIKIKNFDGNSGICSFFDSRGNLDNCKKCDKYKGIKYKRKS